MQRPLKIICPNIKHFSRVARSISPVIAVVHKRWYRSVCNAHCHIGSMCIIRIQWRSRWIARTQIACRVATTTHSVVYALTCRSPEMCLPCRHRAVEDKFLVANIAVQIISSTARDTSTVTSIKSSVNNNPSVNAFDIGVNIQVAFDINQSLRQVSDIAVLAVVVSNIACNRGVSVEYPSGDFPCADVSSSR